MLTELTLLEAVSQQLRLGAGQVEHDSENYVQVVVDAGVITKTHL